MVDVVETAFAAVGGRGCVAVVVYVFVFGGGSMSTHSAALLRVLSVLPSAAASLAVAQQFVAWFFVVAAPSVVSARVHAYMPSAAADTYSLKASVASAAPLASTYRRLPFSASPLLVDPTRLLRKTPYYRADRLSARLARCMLVARTPADMGPLRSALLEP